MQFSELFIQVNGNLSEDNKQQLEADLKMIKGVFAARFNKQKKNHLLILFDASSLTPDQLLIIFKELGYNTQMDNDL